ncbi:TPA: hypothetical protein JD320_000014 [Citrobacter koseri]|uniref:hypothetical protein n=1 Tax=Citrobacter koseri TaxID=545 RepID=UPI001A202916|nr:hypothetical protein [Citrobacter koseri]HDQ2602798.1 hypothetical protein [Citrobacter koseri]
MENILSKYVLRFGQNPPRIDLGILGQRCIFCNKDYSEDLFNTEAHAISEFLYNRTIFHHNECNDCNEKFKNIERDFSNLIEMDKSILSMYGKNGVVQTNLSKVKDSSRIKFDKKYKIPVLNNARPEEGSLSIDPESGDIKIKNIRNSYYNTNVFKCLTKYALSIMPIELIGNYSILTQFVLQGTDLPYPLGYYLCEKKALNNNAVEEIPVTISFNGYMAIHKAYFLSAMPFNGIEVKIINDENIDGLAIFSIFFGSTAFQIFIPNDDFFYRSAVKVYNNEPLNISFPQIVATDFKHDFKNIETTLIDCSIHKKIEKEIDERHFSSVLVPVNKEKLSLNEKGDLVIRSLQINIDEPYKLMRLWSFNLTLLW